jgi:hypothetical protein
MEIKTRNARIPAGPLVMAMANKSSVSVGPAARQIRLVQKEIHRSPPDTAADLMSRRLRST